MKQLNLNELQNSLRTKFLKSKVNLIAPETIFFSKDTKIGKNVTIEPYVVIGSKVKIGNNVTIKGGDHLEDIVTDTYTIRDGVVVIKNNAVIENNTVIGVGATSEKKILESIC